VGTQRALVETIANGEAVLVVGAGSSCKAGHPSWKQLLAALAAAARNVDRGAADAVVGTDAPLLASKYRKILGDPEYQTLLQRVFAPRTPPHQKEHETLVSLPFQDVLTTNFDGVLRSAHHAVYRTAADYCDGDQWERLGDLRSRPRGAQRTYVHLHGSVDRPAEIVLCKEDYDKRYHRDRAFGEFLRTWLLGRRLVFIGFSFSDHDFTHIMRHASAFARSEPRHFAILEQPINPEEAADRAADLRGQYGVETIYFDNSSGDFSELWKLIANLRADVATLEPDPSEVARAVVDALLREILPDPNDREAALRRLPQLVQQLGPSRSTTNTGAGGASAVDQEIDRVFELVTQGRSEDAIQQYEAIRRREGASLTPKQQYRLDANIGNAHYAAGNAAEASKYYLSAVTHYRDSRDARAIEAMGHLLACDHETARHLAEQLCKEEPDFPRAWSLWINAQGDDANLKLLTSQVPRTIRSDAEVAFALADLAARTGELDAQVEHARAAVAASADWPDALSRLGTAILQAERRHVTFNADTLAVPRDVHALREADALLTKAIAVIAGRPPLSRLAGAYFNRSVVRRLLGQEAEAGADISEAFRLNSEEPIIALSFSMEADAEKEMDKALAALARILPMQEYQPQAAFATAWLLLRRRKEDDAKRAFEVLKGVSRELDTAEPAAGRGDIVRLALRALSASDRSDEGPAFVEQLPSEALPDYERTMLLAGAHLRADERERARELAETGIQQLGDGGSWFERREAALLAEDCGLYAEAIDLWQSILSENDTSSDTVHLARAAYRGNHWRVALDVCSATRAAGSTTREHLRIEVAILAESREPDRAVELLRSWLARHSNDKQLTLQLSVLALHDGRPEIAVFDPRRLPSVGEVSDADEGAMLVQVLRRGPEPAGALRTAYGLYRRFPDDHAAHIALLSCVFDPSATPVAIERPDRIGEDTAALVGRDGEQARWIYVETEPDPLSSREEYPASHDFIKSMWSRSAGDTFEYMGHTYRVHRIENRVLRRAQEVAEKYEERFPHGGMLRRFAAPAPPAEGVSLKEQLGEMYEVLKRHDEYWQQLEAMYRDQRLPISTFARMHGRSVFDIVRYLATDPSLGVRADDGVRERWPAAIDAVAQAPEIVLDGTALASALLLDLLDVLPSFGPRLVVPKVVLDQLRHQSLEMRARAPRGTIGLRNEQLFVRELTVDEIAREVELLERVISFIRTECEVAGGEATIDLPQELREKLPELLEQSAIDAVALAARRGCPLWTDDLGLRQLVSELEVGVTGVWTQAVVRGAHARGWIPLEKLHRCHAALLAYGYSLTRLSADDMVGVLDVEGWRMDCRAVRGLVTVVSDVAFLNLHNTLIVALGLKRALERAPRRELARSFIVAVLDTLARDKANLLAEFIYRFPGLRRTRWIRELPSNVAGSEQASAAPRAVLIRVDPFRDGTGRSLKRLMRAWRSQDRELRPNRARARNRVTHRSRGPTAQP
jgi:tetratricopeptide (TPR) repeat protein/predicted nucleic acid-binding protein